MALRVGFVGWRGMVGSVLRERMLAEGDFAYLDPVFFSTSAVGGAPPDVGPTAGSPNSTAGSPGPLRDAHDVAAFADCDVVVTCQGGDWTEAMWPRLRAAGFAGHFIDAASPLRLNPEAMIVLDPVNGRAMQAAKARGMRDWIGGNCTVSLMILGIAGLLDADDVEWVSSMTYQAASGAGAAQMTELVAQMGFVAGQRPTDPAADALAVERAVTASLSHPELPTAALGWPLAANILPYVDRAVADGQSREEAKGHLEAARILGPERAPTVDGTCVRVGALRCHAQGLTVKLRRPLALAEVEARLAGAHPWVRLVPNTREDTLAGLTPAAVSGALTIAVGRVRPMRMGPEFLNVFTVGDQLLWGAAEPLRRTLSWLVTGTPPLGWEGN